MRTERDALGTRDVPDEAWYGIHTVRSLDNFGRATAPLPLEIIYSMVRIKWACARAHAALGSLEREKAAAIEKACARVLAGGFEPQFPLGFLQAGSGTSSHMNVNEVVANVASEEMGGRRGDRRIHPHDDVNRAQSTNDVFPTAVRVALVELSEDLERAVAELTGALRGKAREFEDVLKSARTHLQDAVPVTLGQEFAAWARAIEKDVERLRRARETLRELPLGGTAIGTGLNAPVGFREAAVRELASLLNQTFCPARDGVAEVQFLTDLADFSGALRLLALDFYKIANDMRLLSSGPRTGLGEIALPAVEPGSSIMPGKINPSICEAVNMACLRVMGLDHAVAWACAGGQLELNTHMPLVGACLVEATKLLAHTARMWARNCVGGIAADRARCAQHFESSAGLATVLNPRLGYDRVAELVRECLSSGKTLRQLVIERGLLSETEWDELARAATRPNF